MNQKLVFKPRILVVDDEPLMLDLLREVLNQEKTEPYCLTSSREAAQVVNERKFDGVFLDWVMPEMEGLELAREVRWSRSNSLCPIVMITGKTEPESLWEAFRAGVNFFMQKPVSVDQIKQLVNASRDLMLQEHLRYRRVPLEVPVRCAWEIQDYPQQAEGRSVDLSTTGMRLRVQPTPGPGSLVKLNFTLGKDCSPLSLTGFVARLAPGGDVGIRFINLTPEQRWQLVEFSKKIFEETGT